MVYIFCVLLLTAVCGEVFLFAQCRKLEKAHRHFAEISTAKAKRNKTRLDELEKGWNAAAESLGRRMDDMEAYQDTAIEAKRAEQAFNTGVTNVLNYDMSTAFSDLKKNREA